MSEAAEGPRTLVVERVFPHAPEKVWRALTESKVLAEWMMTNDLEPELGRRFQFRSQPVPNWDGVIECEVLIVEPMKRLAYTWSSLGLNSEVLWTLTAVEGGTHLRLEHSGFGAGQDAAGQDAAGQDVAYKGAGYGWQRFLGNLERVLGGGA